MSSPRRRQDTRARERDDDIGSSPETRVTKKFKNVVQVASGEYSFARGLRDYTAWRKEHGIEGIEVTENADQLLQAWATSVQERYLLTTNKRYNGPAIERLTEKQIGKLAKAGFPLYKCYSAGKNWETKFEEMKAFIQAHGHSPVHRKNLSAQEKELLYFARMQRAFLQSFNGREMRSGKCPKWLVKEHFERLDEIGFDFAEARQMHGPAGLVAKLQKFYNSYGHYSTFILGWSDPLHQQALGLRQKFWKHKDDMDSFTWDDSIIAQFDRIKFDWSSHCIPALLNDLPGFLDKVDKSIKDIDLTSNDDIDYTDKQQVKYPFHSVTSLYGSVGNPLVPVAMAVAGEWIKVCNSISIVQYSQHNPNHRTNTNLKLVYCNLQVQYLKVLEIRIVREELGIDPKKIGSVIRQIDIGGKVIDSVSYAEQAEVSKTPDFRCIATFLYGCYGLQLPQSTKDREWFTHFIHDTIGIRFKYRFDVAWALTSRLRVSHGNRISCYLKKRNLQKTQNTETFSGLRGLSPSEMTKMKELLFLGEEQHASSGERKLYEKDHMHPVAKWAVFKSLADDISDEECLKLVFSIWNLLPTFWAKNCAMSDTCVYHCWVDRDSRIWRYYVPELDKFLTTLELFEQYGDQLLDPDGRGRILFEDWNSGCPADLTVAYSEADARVKFVERKARIAAMVNSGTVWIDSFGEHLKQKPDSKLHQAVRPEELRVMDDIDPYYRLEDEDNYEDSQEDSNH